MSSRWVVKLQLFCSSATLLLSVISLVAMEKNLPSILPDEVQLVDKNTKQPITTLKKSYLPFYDPLLESSPSSIELDLPRDMRPLFLSLLALHNMDLTNYVYCYRNALDGFQASTREAIQVWKNLDFIGYEHDDELCTAIVDYVALKQGPKKIVSDSLKSCSKQLLTDIAKSYYLQTRRLPTSEHLKKYFKGISIAEACKFKGFLDMSEWSNSLTIDCYLCSFLGLGELLKNNKIKEVNFRKNSLTNFDSDLIENQQSQIRGLFLDDNYLQMISLNNFSNLYRLSLNSCKLKSLPDTIFNDCKNLTALYLQDNELTQLPTSIYQTIIIELDIRHNNFTEMPKLYRMWRLRRLLAAHNNIERIPKNSFDGDCFKLTWETRENFGYLRIDLRSNKIASGGIDMHFIKNLTKKIRHIGSRSSRRFDIDIDLDDNPMPKKEFKDFCKTINKLVDKKHNF